MSTAARNVRIVFVMAGDAVEAEKIARSIVEENLAACANIIGPLRSIYRWQGKIENAAEYLIMLKTRTSSYARLQRRVRELHSYQVPEIVALALATGSAPYLDWVFDSTQPPATHRPARTL